MNPRNAHPIDFFNEWFKQPIAVVNNSVAGIIDALNRHPMANDQSAQRLMLHRQSRRHQGKFFVIEVLVVRLQRVVDLYR
jgi:hypothetical protein